MSINYSSTNESYWNQNSQIYINSHPEHKVPNMHPSWGIWHLHENDLQVLTPHLPPGGRILELGCGTGHDLVGFARMGFEAWGVDLSQEQLNGAEKHPLVRYVRAPAELLPFHDSEFHAVFSDHGAFDFSPAETTLRECFRVLKPGGVLAICVYSPLLQACFDRDSGVVRDRLVNAWGGSTVQSSGDVVVFNYTYSEWVNLLIRTGFELVRLEELVAPPGDYMFFRDSLDRNWAERWPAEQMWIARRSAE